MYWSVPRLCVLVARAASRTFAIPKSITLSRKGALPVIITFSGFRSRCTISWACAAASASAICAMISTASLHAIRPRAAISWRSVLPSRSSSTITSCPSSSKDARLRTTLG